MTNNDVDKMKAYRLININIAGENEYHHIWFWAVNKDVRNFLMAFQEVPTGEVSEAQYIEDVKERDFWPCFSSN